MEIRYFQYKLIYKFLATKKMLNIWGIDPSPLCRFYQEVESVEHLFWHCPFVALFWTKVQEWISSHDVNLQLDLFTVLLGDISKHSHAIHANIIILLGKVFIFGLTSVEDLRERFKNLVKCHSRSQCLLAHETGALAYAKRWEKIREAEGWNG